MTMPERNGEPSYYGDSYWNEVNQNRLPGTLAFSTESDNPVLPETNSAWNGGATRLDEYGLMGVRLSGGQVEGVQSYMLFQNQVLCLGAGIENSSGDGLILVLENLRLREDLATRFSMGYDNKDIKTWLKNKEENIVYNEITNSSGVGKGHSWIYTSNVTGGSYGTGIYFPKNMLESVRYRFSNREESGIQNKYLEFWLDLGAKTSYDYVLFPEVVNHGIVNSYFSKPDNLIIENTALVQAAYQMTDNVLAANFWTDAGGTVKSNYHSTLTSRQKASVLMQVKNGILNVAVSDPERLNTGAIVLEIEKKGYEVLQADNGVQADTSGDKIILTVDVSARTGKNFCISINTVPPLIPEDMQEITLVTGEAATIPVPKDMTGKVEWSPVFIKTDGLSTVNTSGYNKIKRELQPGETDGTRTAGPASAGHIVSCETLSDGNCLVTAKEFGKMQVLAEDETGKKKIYNIEVKTVKAEELPSASESDYRVLRENWKESLIGSNLAATPTGREALVLIEENAEKYWNSYAYKGNASCPDVPWPDETDEAKIAAGQKAVGNINTPYCDDAVEFRPAIQHVQAMAKAYAAEGSKYYQDAALMADMVNIMDYLTANCYTPKSQTDNWWTWEIGLPKDLIQTLLLMYEGLSREQIEKYTEPLVFFQPNPYQEGQAGTASTHAQGYRSSQGANLVDCSIIAMGIGALLEDGEYILLAKEASESQFVIQQITDSTLISENGYTSGFYPDGSYLDHSYVPYTGSYGIEFFKGGVNLAAILKNTPWQYGAETISNMESFVLDGFAPAVYKNIMMDMLRGRAVSRANNTGRTAGRDIMMQMLKLLDAVTPKAQAEFKNYIKSWLLADPDYPATLTKAEQLPVRAKAEEILADSSITGELVPYHKSMSYMDRAIHFSGTFLFGLSMYSSRIQNCEVTNSENRYGWHQGDGMTYIYNNDMEQYTENYWNTVNPYRLPGTTAVPVNIGNGTPDSSGYYQEGDYRSFEDWAGGSSIGENGISGMQLSGDINAKAVAYAPDLRAKKSWFMFGSEILCLGSDITNTGSLSTETTVENRKLNQTGSNLILADGRELVLPAAENQVSGIVNHMADVSGEAVSNVSWLHMEGNCQGAEIGYYFPEKPSNLYIRKTKNTGDFIDIGTTSGEESRTYMELWFDHGSNPVSESYQYILLPGMTAEQTENYALNPQIEVLVNSELVQAARHNGLGLTGANFWTNTEQSAGGITADKKASVMLMEDRDNNTLTIAVSDPTMKNEGSIHIAVDRKGLSKLSSDKNVSVELRDDKIYLTVQTANTNGTSSYAVISVEGAPELSIEEILERLEEDESLLKSQEMQSIIRNAVKKLQETDNSEIIKNESRLSEIWRLETYVRKAFPNIGETILDIEGELLPIFNGSGSVKGAAFSVPLTTKVPENVRIIVKKENQSASTGSTITLEGKTIGLDLANSRNIQISMDLENKDGVISANVQPLVPFEIKLPVPQGISNERPVYVGHIGSNQNISWQRAIVADQQLSFIVTELSPFIIANGTERTSSGGNSSSRDDREKTGGKWVFNSTGWWYQRANGTWPANTWEKINGIWYLFDTNGYMQTGWQKRGDYWFYMNTSGAMLENAWVNTSGIWYYLGHDGIMAANAWLFYKEQWYYLKENGAMAAEEWVDEKQYYVGQDGIFRE